MQTLDGHFDGKVVILDVPVKLQANTRVKVLVPDSAEREEFSMHQFTLMAEPSFEKIWNNPLDTDYDKL
jgi:hypothetical protein